MQSLAFLLARFSEPSSYAGLGALLALVGLHFSDDMLGQGAQVFAALCGLLALILRERGVIKTIAVMVMVGAGLTACGGTAPVQPAVPANVQTACGVVSWGVPIVEAMAARLNPNGQAILATAEKAVTACAAGDAPGTIADVAAALTAIIYPPAA